MAVDTPSLIKISQFFGACVVLPYLAWQVFSKSKQHPPGPRGLPLIGEQISSSSYATCTNQPIRLTGNTHQAPRPFSWKWYEELRNTYGKIFRLRVLGDNFVILNDPKVAEDLLGRRSANYASRKFLPYASFYRSGNKRMILMPYGDEFKKQRAAMAMLFRPDGEQVTYFDLEMITYGLALGILSNRHRQEQQGKKFLFDIMNSPKDYASHLKQYSAGIALGVSFGMSIEQAHIEAPNLIANTAAVGADVSSSMFQWLNKLPDWLARWRPGAIIKHEGEVTLFTRFSKHAMPQNPPTLQGKSLVAQLWDTKDELGLDDRSILYIGGSVGEAGRAQEEIDRVVGDRMPTFEDYMNLPYTFALVKEALRWIPVTPLSFPHISAQDDVYDGLYIPKESQVVASIWNMHRDPNVYTDPAAFDPLRWYEPTSLGKVRDDASLFDGVWTFGSCPGKRLAVDSLWIGITHLLWAFDIADKHPEIAVKRTSEEVDANLTWRDAVNIEPRVLDLKISPRDEGKARKIREEWEALKEQ
ncbi:hypothetical protein DXG01_012715 [Tephrocybe rancida]|nr:hypothetical protein DXG01_012715 [Tephrocybe rancida]